MKMKTLNMVLLFLLLCFSMSNVISVYALTDIYFGSNVDGFTWMYGTDYNSARNSLTGFTSNTSITLEVGQNWNDPNYEFKRLLLFFDTSNLPDDAILISAKLYLWGYADFSGTDFNIIIQNGQPTYPHIPIMDIDYNLINYMGNGGSLHTVNFVISQYNEIVLNNDGLEWINKTGITKFCLRSDNDINGFPPIGNEYVVVYSSEANEEQKPKLEIVYSISTEPVVYEWFSELFFGTGAWLGLLIVISIIFIVTAKEKLSGIVFLPITVLMAINYFNNVPSNSDFMWSGVIMLLMTVYCLGIFGYGIKERG